MWAKIPKFLRNKYILALLVLIVWISFFDNNDLFTRRNINRNLKELREQRDFYRAEIDKDSVTIKELETNPEALEKFAREEYLMKKENEDIYLFNYTDTTAKE